MTQTTFPAGSFVRHIVSGRLYRVAAYQPEAHRLSLVRYEKFTIIGKVTMLRPSLKRRFAVVNVKSLEALDVTGLSILS